MKEMKIGTLILFLAVTFGFSCQQEKPKVTDTKPPPTTTSVISKQAAPFKVVESSYSVTSGFGDTFLKWVAVIENPNTDAYGVFPTVTITARDDNGAVVGTEDQVLNELPPGTKIAWAGQITVTKTPKTVEIVPTKVEWRTTVTKPDDDLTFQTDKVNISSQGKNSYQVAGDLINPYNKEIDQLAVTVLLRNEEGKLLGGETSFVDALSAKRSRPFLVKYIAAEGKPKKAEIFVIPWGQVSWNSLAAGK